MTHSTHHTAEQRLAPLVAGVVAGAANVASGYAFDTVKVRLQTGRYSGMVHCFKHIVKHEGVRGLYQGLTPPLIGGAAETGINYLVYSRLLAALSDPLAAPGSLQQLPGVALSGAGAGVALSVILGPTELLKCRLQTTGQHLGPAAVLRQVVREEGLAGLGRGLGATLIREVPGNAIFFTTYEVLRASPWLSSSVGGSNGRSGGSRGNSRESTGRQGQDGVTTQLLDVARGAGSAIFCGGIAGVVMWGTVLPLDVAKSRIQVARPGGPWDIGVAAHLRMLHTEGGARALWAGLAPTLARAFPANAAQWLAYELVMRQLGAHGP